MAHNSTEPWRRSKRRPICVFAALVAAAMLALPSVAQVPLSAVNNETSVREISFKYVEGGSFRESALEDQLWHDEPGFWDKVTRILPFVSAPPFPFNPVELQKDVVRLRRYYQRNGFLHPSIDYPASQVDTSSNRIHIIFSIREGPPLIIQDVGFFTGEAGYTAESLTDDVREAWIEFRDQVTLETGRRYTEFEGIRLQDEVLTWFKNAGFAFAQVDREAVIDSVANTVDLRFQVDPGPRGYISEILVEGNESVHERVILRELPFSVGDRFSAEELSQGQRELFELNLFRVAVSEVPEQPRDSTVVVRYRVREARPRHLSAQTGYGLDQGALLQGSWTHRNFLGGARQLTATTTFTSGYGAARVGGFPAAQQKSATVTLRQPYIFTRKLSGTFSPHYIRGQDDRLNIRFEEAELNTTLLYTIYNFRTLTFRHSISRANPLGQAQGVLIPGDTLAFDQQRTIDIFTQNTFTLTGNLGKVDDFLRPTRGFRIRPHAEVGGVVVQLPDDVDYFKGQTELVGYLPLAGDYALSGRLFLGNIWPQGESRRQTAPQIEYRFDRIRYYAGGANDVRGWPADQLGPKIVRPDTAFTEAGTVSVDDDGNPEVSYRLEPAGGLGKIAANVELRTPMPLLGESWRGAVFLDAGQVFPTEAEEEELRIRDISPSDLRLGTGVGLRYETLVGFLRLDLGFKINPTIEDLASPREVYQLQNGLISPDEVETSIRDRFRFHLSIGQTF